MPAGSCGCDHDRHSTASRACSIDQQARDFGTAGIEQGYDMRPFANSGMTPLAERRRCSALSRKAWFAHRTSFSPRRAHAWAVPLRRWTGRQRKAWARLEETPNPPRSAGWLFPALHKRLQSPASPRGFFLSIANRPRATMACRSTTSRGIPAVRSTSASGLLFFWTAG